MHIVYRIVPWYGELGNRGRGLDRRRRWQGRGEAEVVKRHNKIVTLFLLPAPSRSPPAGLRAKNRLRVFDKYTRSSVRGAEGGGRI